MKINARYLIFALVITTACNKPLTITGTEQKDTLRVVSGNFEVEGREALVREYYLRFGIVIPKFYSVKDFLPIDLNDDNLVDTLVVFSPVLLEDPKYFDFKSDRDPNRLLVEIFNIGAKSTIGNIYENVISNGGGVLSKYGGIAPTENGFEVVHQSGSRYAWTVISEFKTNQDSLLLVTFKKMCSLEGLEDTIQHKFPSRSARLFNINDTIKNNCNCDPVWKSLENRLENEN